MSEVENSLPDNWALCKLGDVMKLRNGYAFKSKDYSAEGVPLIRISDINNNIVSTERAAKIPVDLVHEGYLIEDGDLLIAMSGATTGKTGVYKGKEKILQNQRVGNFKIIDEAVVSKGYRNYYVMSLRKAIEGAAYGGAQPNIAAKDIDEFPFPLAPPEQQKRIVAKIEELFSHIDAGIAALNNAKQLLKQYRQSVLKAAVTGELTKQWREDRLKDDVQGSTSAAGAESAGAAKLEPASQLLERILRERRQKWEVQQLEQFKAKGKVPKDDGWKGKYKEPFGEYEESCGLPQEWCWATIDQLGKVQLGRQRSPKNRSNIYPTKYVRAANITQQGLDFSDLMDMEFTPDEFERYVMKANDLVLSEASGSPDQVGKPAIWRDDMPVCCFQNTVVRHRPHVVVPDYLLVHYKYFYWCQVFSKAAGGVGINHLSAQKFLQMSIALPSLLEQETIVNKVNQRFDALKRLGDKIDVQLTNADKNKQSILASAFSGKLEI